MGGVTLAPLSAQFGCPNTRSHRGASNPRISVPRSLGSARLVSGSAGRARNRTSRSPTRHRCSSQYPHAEARAVSRMLNVFAGFPTRTNVN